MIVAELQISRAKARICRLISPRASMTWKNGPVMLRTPPAGTCLNGLLGLGGPGQVDTHDGQPYFANRD